MFRSITERPVLLPGLMAIFCAISVPLISYSAIAHKLVYTTPYIFDYGRTGYPTGKSALRRVSAAEKCAYMIFINVFSLLLFGVIYIRYKKVKYACDHISFAWNTYTYPANIANLTIGVIIAVTLPLLGNFSGGKWVDSAIVIVGMPIGAIMMLYQIIDVSLSIMIYSIFGGICLITTKIVLFIICLYSYIVYYKYYAMSEYPTFLDHDNKIIYTPDIRGYDIHVYAATHHWVLSVAMFIYFCLLSILDFFDIYFEEPEVTVDGDGVIEFCDYRSCTLDRK